MSVGSAPFDQRTPEQHEAVRRRSFVFSICGVACGLAGLVLLMSHVVEVEHPPVVLAVNLSFCAIMMGIGLVLYAKPTPGTGRSVLFSTVAMALGLAGTLVFARQSAKYHGLVEQRELGNARGIETAAWEYAKAHEGHFPEYISELLVAGSVQVKNLRSPFGTSMNDPDIARIEAEVADLRAFVEMAAGSGFHFESQIEALNSLIAQELDTHSDYDYLGNGLELAVKSPGSFTLLPDEIVIATSHNAIMGRQFAMAFADGRAEFVDQGSAASALLKSNDARVNLGLGTVRIPDVIRRAQEAERMNPSEK